MTVTLVPTRFYLASTIYDAAGNVMCPWCGGFSSPLGQHYCREKANVIPVAGGGFVWTPSPSPSPKEDDRG